MPGRMAGQQIREPDFLRISASRSPEFTGHEVIGRPRSADEDFAVFQLAGRAGAAVLLALHRFFIDQVGDIDEHAATMILATTQILLERKKEFVYLDRDAASLSLPFPMPNCLFPEQATILAAGRSTPFA